MKQGELELAELKEKVAKDMDCNPKTVERALNNMVDVERVLTAGTSRKKVRMISNGLLEGTGSNSKRGSEISI